MIAKGYDTVEETLNLRLNGEFLDRLEDAKARAKDSNGGDGVAPVAIGSGDFTEIMHVRSHGGQGGVRYFLDNDDFLIRVRPQSTWGVSVRYKSAGLWEHGVKPLSDRIFTALHAEGKPGCDKWATVKRVDFACDFHAPAFSPEMVWSIMDALVSRMKFHPVGSSAGVETITMGSMANLQIQVYDKGREIREVSGKDWMPELWAREGYDVPSDGQDRDVWRVEIRFSKNFLRDRGINYFDQAEENMADLVAEALYSNRLTRPTGDSNRRRWPLHPLWTLAADAAAGDAMLPMGRMFTMRREELRRQLLAQAAGTMRAAGILEKENFEQGDAVHLGQQIERKLVGLSGDRKAVGDIKERYRFMDEPR